MPRLKAYGIHFQISLLILVKHIILILHNYLDPKIDCVFKAMLGSEENRNLLVHFLNAVLIDDLTAPITEAEILNPYNDKEFLDDKLSCSDSADHIPVSAIISRFFPPKGGESPAYHRREEE